MRLRDKRLEAEPTVEQKRRRKREISDRHYEGNVRLKGEFAELHEKRIQQLEQKVQRDEEVLKKKGINPTRPKSASDFDRLVGNKELMPQ